MIEWLLHLAQALIFAIECGATGIRVSPPEAPMWKVRSVEWSLEVRGFPCEPTWDQWCGLVVYDNGSLLQFFPCEV